MIEPFGDLFATGEPFWNTPPDRMTWLRVLFVLLWGSLVSLDDRGPRLLNAPLLTGTVTGLILGEPRIGMAFGLSFQILWPVLIGSGGNIRPAAGIGSVTATIVAVSIGDSGGAVMGCLFGLGTADLGRSLEGAHLRRNIRRESRALEGFARAGGGPLPETQLASGLYKARWASAFDSLGRGAALTLLATGAGWSGTWLPDPFLNDSFWTASLLWILPVFLALGIGTAFPRLGGIRRRGGPAWLLGIVAGALVTWLLEHRG